MAVNTREEVLKALVKIEKDEIFSNTAMKQMLSAVKDEQEKNFAAGLLMGILQNRIRLDNIIGQFSKIKRRKMSVWICNILRMGIYQILDMQVPSHAACNECVKLARRYGHTASAGFVNGVLRAAARNPEAIRIPPKENAVPYFSFTYSCPEWMAEKLLKQYGFDETEKILGAYHKIYPPTVRTNLLKTTPEELKKRLETEGKKITIDKKLPYVLHVEGRLNLECSEAYQQGLYTLQNINSMYAAEILSPQPGETIMDLCAAPGGKTTHIAEKMQDRGEVLAFDIYPHKIALIEHAARRLGISCIRAEMGNAEETKAEYLEKADRVLLDAPCSGLGVIQKKPDICWRRREEDITALAGVQKRMLDTAAGYVKKNGVLVYSTCTILKEENEEQIEKFLLAHPEFEKCEAHLYHTYTNGGSGFYICKMQKTGR